MECIINIYCGFVISAFDQMWKRGMLNVTMRFFVLVGFYGILCMAEEFLTMCPFVQHTLPIKINNNRNYLVE